MSMTLSGDGTITGLVEGGLPNGTVQPSDLSTGAPTWTPAGNLGLNVTPSAWGSSYKAIQILGPSGTVAGSLWQTQSNILQVGNNVYSATGGDTYYSTGSAVKYTQTTTEHRWYTAPSGTAGNAITFTERLRIGSAGQIGIGGANYGTSGQVLTSQGSSAAPVWGDAIESRTLLGTLNATGVSTQTLSGLDLTGYSRILAYFNSIKNNSSGFNITFAGVVVVSGTASGAVYSGPIQIDLFGGGIFSAILNATMPASGGTRGGICSVTQASTSITTTVTNTFTGGSITIYGVK